MTDLERVRKVLQMYGAKHAEDILDAHRKEDAEREERAYAEGVKAGRETANAALRAELSRESSLLADARLELTELRADHEAVYARLLEVREQADELAELREDRDRLKSNLLALDTAAVKRYDELREAVRSYLDFEHGSVKHVREQRLRQLIEEKE